MNIIEKLTKHYQTQPPKLDFGGSEGTAFQTQVFEEWPDHEAIKPLGGVTVWRYRTAVSPKDILNVRYCVVDVCLDVSGRDTPAALPLPPEMQNQPTEIVVYVDHLDCIRMRAIGSYA